LPRVTADERLERDDRIFDLWLKGYTYREIGADPWVRLGKSHVHRVVQRERLAMDVVELLHYSRRELHRRSIDGHAAATGNLAVGMLALRRWGRVCDRLEQLEGAPRAEGKPGGAEGPRPAGVRSVRRRAPAA
jgi:hypothetical protein